MGLVSSITAVQRFTSAITAATPTEGSHGGPASTIGGFGARLTRPHEADPAVEQAWLTVYRAPDTHWDLYQLGEELTDLEDAFRLWRFRHVTTVERVIGFKRGTGGTNGVNYLRKMLDTVLFPEIWKLRTDR